MKRRWHLTPRTSALPGIGATRSHGRMSRALPALTLAVLGLLASPIDALDGGQAEAVDRLAASVPADTSVAAVMANHYAVLLWVEDYCNGRSVASVRAYIQAKGNVNPDAFETAWAAAATMLANTDSKAMCALALEQYGPDGALIKGGWAPKP